MRSKPTRTIDRSPRRVRARAQQPLHLLPSTLRALSAIETRAMIFFSGRAIDVRVELRVRKILFPNADKVRSTQMRA